jgi:hypothetical protein
MCNTHCKCLRQRGSTSNGGGTGYRFQPGYKKLGKCRAQSLPGQIRPLIISGWAFTKLLPSLLKAMMSVSLKSPVRYVLEDLAGIKKREKTIP